MLKFPHDDVHDAYADGGAADVRHQRRYVKGREDVDGSAHKLARSNLEGGGLEWRDIKKMRRRRQYSFHVTKTG
jgi:hypothetical protein